jgi:hypothetical protein
MTPLRSLGRLDIQSKFRMSSKKLYLHSERFLWKWTLIEQGRKVFQGWRLSDNEAVE